jgi:hypothetical protein
MRRSGKNPNKTTIFRVRAEALTPVFTTPI